MKNVQDVPTFQLDPHDRGRCGEAVSGEKNHNRTWRTVAWRHSRVLSAQAYWPFTSRQPYCKGRALALLTLNNDGTLMFLYDAFDHSQP